MVVEEDKEPQSPGCIQYIFAVVAAASTGDGKRPGTSLEEASGDRELRGSRKSLSICAR